MRIPHQFPHYRVEMSRSPARHLIGQTCVGHYRAIGSHFARVEETALAAGITAQLGPRIGVFFDDRTEIPGPERRCFIGFEAAGLRGVEGLEEMHLPSSPVAVLRYAGAPEGLPDAYRYLLHDWLPASGRFMVSSPFEIYPRARDARRPDRMQAYIHLPMN